MAGDIGTAYIRIAPNMSGLQGKISNGLKGTGKQFSEQFSGELTSGSAVIAGALAGITSSVTSKAMSVISNSVDAAVSRVDTLARFPKVMQNLGYEAGDASDQIARIAKNLVGLPTSLDSLATFVTRVAPVTGTLQKATDVALAFNNAVLAGGGPTYRQADAIEQFSQMLSKGVPDLMAWRTLQEAMPATLGQVAKKLGDQTGNTQKLYEKLQEGKVTFQDFTDAVVSLNTEGLPGFKSFADQAKDSTTGISTGVQNMQTAVTRGVASILNAFGQANISEALANIGTAFESALKSISKVITFVSNNREVLSALAVSIGAVTAAILVLHAVDVARDFVAVVQTARLGAAALQQLTVTTRAASAMQLVFNAVLSANPITILIIAIAALVAGLVYFFTQTKMGKEMWADFTSYLMSTWQSIKSGFASVGDFFSGVWDNIKSGLSAVGGFFKGVWDKISSGLDTFLNFFKDHWRIIILVVLGPLGLLIDLVTAYWSEITGAISTAVSNVWGVITNVFNSIVGFLTNIWNRVFQVASTGVSAVWNVISTVFSAVAGFMTDVFGPPISAIINAFQWLGGIIAGVASNIWEGLTNTFNAVVGFLGGVASKVIGIFSGAGRWLFDAGKNIIEGLINGAQSLLSRLGTFFLDAIPDWIKGPFKKALGIHSPSTVFESYGANITQGLINGINGGTDAISSAVNSLTGAAMSDISSSMNSPISIPSTSVGSVGSANTTNIDKRQDITLKVYPQSAAATQEIFRQLNQDTMNVGMGLTPAQGAM